MLRKQGRPPVLLHTDSGTEREAGGGIRHLERSWKGGVAAFILDKEGVTRFRKVSNVDLEDLQGLSTTKKVLKELQ